MRFLGLGSEDVVPDAKTVCLFREQLTCAGAIEELLAAFDAWLKGKGYLAMSGQIIDAVIIAAPRQPNTDTAGGLTPAFRATSCTLTRSTGSRTRGARRPSLSGRERSPAIAASSALAASSRRTQTV